MAVLSKPPGNKLCRAPVSSFKGSSALETLDDRCVAERDDVSFGQTKFWDRLKGDRNAYEEISADDVGGTFSGRMRDFLWCVRGNSARTRAGALFR